MKVRYVAAPALVLAMLLTTPSASFADATSTPKPTLKPTPALDIESPIGKYEIAVDKFHAEMKAREKTLKKITQKFVADVNQAMRLEKTSMKSAKTVDAKRMALAQREISVALAASARAAAITAMGPAPLEPEKSLKLLKSVEPAKSLKLVDSVEPEEIEPMKTPKSDRPRSTRKK